MIKNALIGLSLALGLGVGVAVAAPSPAINNPTVTAQQVPAVVSKVETATAPAVATATVTSFDFSPLVNTLLSLLTPLLTAGVAILVPWALKLMRVNINAKQLEAINDGFDKAIGFGLNKVKPTLVAQAGKWSPQVQNQLVIEAAKYAQDNFPDLLKFFKLKTTDQVAPKIVARLEAHPSVPTSNVTSAIVK